MVDRPVRTWRRLRQSVEGERAKRKKTLAYWIPIVIESKTWYLDILLLKYIIDSTKETVKVVEVVGLAAHARMSISPFLSPLPPPLSYPPPLSRIKRPSTGKNAAACRPHYQRTLWEVSKKENLPQVVPSLYLLPFPRKRTNRGGAEESEKTHRAQILSFWKVLLLLLYRYCVL